MNDERVLIKRVRKGDREAFDVLFSRYGERVRAFALRLCGNESMADDLTQDAFLAAFRSIAGYRGGAPFFSWLCGIVVRRHRDALRRVPTEWGLEARVSPAEEGHPDVDRAIAALKPDQREVFVLIKVVGLTQTEAAQVLRKPVGTVKWLCYEAVRSLQLTLKEAYPHELKRSSSRPHLD